MVYVVKMNGEKVRSFDNVDLLVVRAWANKHCQGVVDICSLSECAELPRASSRIYPNEDLGKLTYKPFVSLA